MTPLEIDIDTRVEGHHQRIIPPETLLACHLFRIVGLDELVTPGYGVVNIYEDSALFYVRHLEELLAEGVSQFDVLQADIRAVLVCKTAGRVVVASLVSR